jgi:regulator of PEP synthase PpsR (kinase-PPPase family)
VHLAQLISQFLHYNELRSANFPLGQELTQVELFKKVPKKHEEQVVALEVHVLHIGEHS